MVTTMHRSSFVFFVFFVFFFVFIFLLFLGGLPKAKPWRATPRGHAPSDHAHHDLTGFLSSVDWVLLGDSGVLPGFVVFYRVLLGFTEFSKCSLDFTEKRSSFTGFYWVSRGFTGFHWESLEFYWVVSFLFTEFDWVSSGNKKKKIIE